MNTAFNFLLFLCTSLFLNGQCLDPLLHNTSSNSIWLSCFPSSNPLTELGTNHWILYEFEEGKSIEGFRIWNINNPDLLDAGAKRIRIDVSTDGASWNNIGTVNLQQGSDSKDYLGDEFDDLGTHSVQFVLLTVLENHGGTGCAGLGEVLFKLGEGTTPTIEERLNALVTIAPNPGNDIIKVYLDGIITKKISYTLFDMLGRSVERDIIKTYGSQNEFTIDGSSLADGHYALKLETDEGPVSKKIVVIHPK